MTRTALHDVLYRRQVIHQWVVFLRNSAGIRHFFFRPEGTTRSKPGARQGESHEPCRCPGFGDIYPPSPNGTALIPGVSFVQFQSMTAAESTELILKGHSLMMLWLVLDVLLELVTKIVAVRPRSPVLRGKHNVDVDLRQCLC